MSCPEDACNLPESIDPEEHLIRVVKSPYHYNKGKSKLSPKLLHPAAGKSDISVMRQILGDAACSEKARSISGNLVPPAEYKGMAIFCAKDVNASGSCCYDHRDDFCGHAHINHNIRVPDRHETWDPAIKMIFDERCRTLLQKLKRFVADSIDAGSGGEGELLSK